MKRKLMYAGALTLALLAITGALLYTGVIWFNMPSRDEFPVWGVDISNWQGDVNWPMLTAQGIGFAYIKATEGSTFTDARFAENWRGALEAGVPVGAYHFLSGSSTGEAQAAHFIAAVPRLEGTLPPVIDIEVGINMPEINEILDDMINTLETHYGAPPVLYVTYDTYAAFVKGKYEHCPIWIRDIISKPALPDGREWLLWQYSNRGRLAGYAGDEAFVDLNVLAGGALALDALILAGEAVLNDEIETMASAEPVPRLDLDQESNQDPYQEAEMNNRFVMPLTASLIAVESVPAQRWYSPDRSRYFQLLEEWGDCETPLISLVYEGETYQSGSSIFAYESSGLISWWLDNRYILIDGVTLLDTETGNVRNIECPRPMSEQWLEVCSNPDGGKLAYFAIDSGNTDGGNTGPYTHIIYTYDLHADTWATPVRLERDYRGEELPVALLWGVDGCIYFNTYADTGSDDLTSIYRFDVEQDSLAIYESGAFLAHNPPGGKFLVHASYRHPEYEKEQVFVLTDLDSGEKRMIFCQLYPNAASWDSDGNLIWIEDNWQINIYHTYTWEIEHIEYLWMASSCGLAGRLQYAMDHFYLELYSSFGPEGYYRVADSCEECIVYQAMIRDISHPYAEIYHMTEPDPGDPLPPNLTSLDGYWHCLPSFPAAEADHYRFDADSGTFSFTYGLMDFSRRTRRYMGTFEVTGETLVLTVTHREVMVGGYHIPGYASVITDLIDAEITVVEVMPAEVQVLEFSAIEASKIVEEGFEPYRCIIGGNPWWKVSAGHFQGASQN